MKTRSDDVSAYVCVIVGKGGENESPSPFFETTNLTEVIKTKKW